MSKSEPLRLEQGRPKLLAGIRRHHKFIDGTAGIPLQWEDFKKIGHIPERKGANSFGVMCGVNETGFEYMCAVEVESFAHLPDALGRMRIDEQLYAIFLHTDHVSTIRSTWQKALYEWLLSSEYQSAQKPDFEVYGDKFDPDSGEGGVEIWLSIVRTRQ